MGRLVQKVVRVRGKGGKTFTRKQWVRSASVPTVKKPLEKVKKASGDDAFAKDPSTPPGQLEQISQGGSGNQKARRREHIAENPNVDPKHLSKMVEESLESGVSGHFGRMLDAANRNPSTLLWSLEDPNLGQFSSDTLRWMAERPDAPDHVFRVAVHTKNINTETLDALKHPDRIRQAWGVVGRNPALFDVVLQNKQTPQDVIDETLSHNLDSVVTPSSFYTAGGLLKNPRLSPAQKQKVMAKVVEHYQAASTQDRNTWLEGFESFGALEELKGALRVARRRR